MGNKSFNVYNWFVLIIVWLSLGTNNLSIIYSSGKVLTYEYYNDKCNNERSYNGRNYNDKSYIATKPIAKKSYRDKIKSRNVTTTDDIARKVITIKSIMIQGIATEATTRRL